MSFLFGSVALLALILPFEVCANQSLDDIEAGRLIYNEGKTASGQVISAQRAGISLSGKDAACVSCHRPSGMGSVEGNQQIPPITANALFMEQGRVISNMDLRTGKRFNPTHPPYTSATLSAAIANGINANGQEMTSLMPRFQLSDDEMHQLTAYLKSLSAQNSPGVLPRELRLATVITPDTDPVRKQLLLEILQAKVAEKNISSLPGRGAGRRHMVSSAELLLGTERRWTLDVWELQGPADTWQRQVEAYYAKRPVFALLSGLGKTWKPVSDFCNKYKVPAWFPSVDTPPEHQQDGYTLYFQQGSRLEAHVLAQYLEMEKLLSKPPAKTKLIQVYDENDAGIAEPLQGLLANKGVTVINRPLHGVSSASLKAAFAGLGSTDVVMLWLRDKQLQLLQGIPMPTANVFLSAKLAAAEIADIPTAWKKNARVIYPYELPAKRKSSMDYFHQWMAFNEIPLVDEPLQAEAYFATEYLSQTTADMLDNMYRDYLLERAEALLSFSESAKSEQRMRNRQTMSPADRSLKAIARRHGLAEGNPVPNTVMDDNRSTTIYPHMGLGPGQRYASKGAYVVKFSGAQLEELQPVSNWVIPDGL